MRSILCLSLLLSCTLVERSAYDRDQETLARHHLFQHKSSLRGCTKDKKVQLRVFFNQKGQIYYFTANNGRAEKKLTDCLHKVLDLIYVKEIERKLDFTLNL